MNIKQLLAGALLLPAPALFSQTPAANTNDTLAQQQQLLVSIGKMIQQKHYSPKPFDDAFSEKVFDNFLTQLDGEKNIFLQSDIDSLSKYRTTIDDEIEGNAPMDFYPAAIVIFKKRRTKLKELYTEILSKPFNFSKDELYQPLTDSLHYPADEAADIQAWRQRLKYRTLLAYSNLLTQKEKAKPTDNISKKSNAELEKEARNSVKAFYDRYFESRFNAEAFNTMAQFSLFVNAIAHETDPHTDYFSPIEERSFQESLTNSFYGIGVQLDPNLKDGQPVITGIIVGGAAWKSKKIDVGDAILKIGEGNEPMKDISGYSMIDIIKMVHGAEGTTVKLAIRKASNGLVQEVSLTRQKVNVEQASAKSLIIRDNNKKIGYIYLPEFYANLGSNAGVQCSTDVKKEIEKLKTENIDGLIIDLRNNPGGSVADAAKMIGFFVPQGPALQLQLYTNGKKQRQIVPDYNTDSSGLLYSGPMTVMVNEMTASAAEIFAGAMQNYHRAIIIGSTTTYGKGTAQMQLPLGKTGSNHLPEYGELKLTIGKFYRINGGSTQLKGVSPDIVIPDLYEALHKQEKDNRNALAWDEIASAAYTPWQPAYNMKNILSEAQKSVDNNPVFKSIIAVNNLQKTNRNMPVSLDLVQYRKNLSSVQKLQDIAGEAAASVTPLSVTASQTDYNKFYKNSNKAEQGMYQNWIKNVSKDVYIRESVKILNSMIKD
ncbi:hypothetical protein A9P82_01065 [Arachidicoccus ginsenosidimutans]|uniref:carboxy terminal-processing peptidase n=1 Tax=Arachidicoccus sp. BS20 TaxID=1850526 RepID=UPI0007F16E19|nr:carboxy terminal-processing peptidase [Arachidicoccus sp. BS20]ANI88033.1 hypothetical protein A9P82_01065 [Arachidicoccus sp. BS20]